jgi:hypothetical protein
MSSEGARQALDALLLGFAQQTGASGLATGEDGVCSLVFDGRMRVNLRANPATGELVVWSNLGDLPAGRAEPVLRALMRANLFGQGTRGGTLGLMPEGDDVVLAVRRPLDGMDVAALTALIELMIERHEALAPIVRAEGVQAPAAAPPAALQSAIRA